MTRLRLSLLVSAPVGWRSDRGEHRSRATAGSKPSARGRSKTGENHVRKSLLTQRTHARRLRRARHRRVRANRSHGRAIQRLGSRGISRDGNRGTGIGHSRGRPVRLPPPRPLVSGRPAASRPAGVPPPLGWVRVSSRLSGCPIGETIRTRPRGCSGRRSHVRHEQICAAASRTRSSTGRASTSLRAAAASPSAAVSIHSNAWRTRTSGSTISSPTAWDSVELMAVRLFRWLRCSGAVTR